MGFSPNIISVGPIERRPETAIVCVDIVNVIPPELDIKVVNGELIIVDNTPRFKGQVKVYKEDNNIIRMYVVVESNFQVVDGIESSTLAWKPVAFINQIIDSTTGLPFQSL